MMVHTQQPTQVAIAVVREGGRYLVGVRPAGKPLAGLAEFPGGKVNAGETPSQAAQRECLEESGLSVVIGAKYFSATHRYQHGLLEIHFFDCHPARKPEKGSFAPVQDPRLPFRWVTIDELATLDFPAANQRLTDLLIGSAKLSNASV